MFKKVIGGSRLTGLAAAMIACMPPAFGVPDVRGGRLFMAPQKEKSNRQFYSLQSKQTDKGVVVELRIYDEIGFWGVTAKDFIDQLHAVAADAVEVIVAVNSPGGDVFDAFAIYNALRRYAGKITSRVDGIAASAASLIVMAGDQVVMPENTMLMIHNPWTVAIGTAEDMRKTAEMMDKARDGIVAAYRAKSGQSDAELIRMMDEETWLTALEAQALGFCDVIENPVKLAASVRTSELLAKFQKTPADLLAQLTLQSDPPAPAPGPAPTPTPGPTPTPTPAPVPVPANAAALAVHVFSTCRADGIGHLAEGVLLTSGLNEQVAVDARIFAAKEIASLCLAAKLPDMAVGFVAAGMNVEQARARLFDAVTALAADDINNHQRPGPAHSSQGGLNVADIYAKRQSAHSNNQSSRRY